MGLDMYLVRKRFVRDWTEDGEKESERERVKITGIKMPDDCKVRVIELEGIYWRKTNAIHNWFVENVQEGKDDCDEYHVEVKDLESLLEKIKQVLMHRKLASELLPTVGGFFFGGTEYDRYYWEELKRTKSELEKLLLEHEDGWFYYYQSSW